MKTAVLLALTLLSLTTSPVHAQYGYGKPPPPYGGDDDVSSAKSLWGALAREQLVGNKVIHSTPYQGIHPHGAVLETLEAVVNVSGHKGVVIVKRNYGGSGASKGAVATNPEQYLQAITVMFKRERGYDADNKDWFWVQYTPSGEIFKDAQGRALAGRVAKDSRTEGCIACHRTAPGGDYVFNHDRYAFR
jgi:Cytochrome P460